MKKLIAVLTTLVVLASFNPVAAFTSNTHSTNLVAASSQSLSIADASQSGLDTGNNISLSLWVKFTTTPSSGTSMQLAGKLVSVSGGYRIQLGNEGGTLRLRGYYAQSGAADDSYFYTNWTPSTGTWYHVVVTIAAATNAVTIYIDNVSKSVTNEGTSSKAISDSTAAFAVGSLPTGGSYLNGDIDEVLVYNAVINSTVIGNLYTDPCNPSTTNLVSRWAFDNDGTDSQGSNDLTNNNSATFSTTHAFDCAAAAATSIESDLIIFE